MADASFHLPRNAVQVQSWIALLEGDALKRCRRDRGSDRAFWAVPRMLIAVRAMLAADPEKRPNVRRVVRSFAGALREVPASKGDGVLGIRVHCGGLEKGGAKQKQVVKREKEEKRHVNGKTVLGEVLGIENIEGREDEGAEDRSKEVVVVASSESVSEFDFGFSDVGSESGTNEEEQVGESSGLEEEDVDLDGIVEIDRVSPQLSLPDLDVHITGIEGLTVHEQ